MNDVPGDDVDPTDGPADRPAAPADESTRPDAVAPPAPPSDGPTRPGRVQPPPHRHRGWLYAGRSVAALAAVVTLLSVGWDWRIKDRAEVGLQVHAVQALDTGDTHISTARTIPTVVTNSRGVKTTESVKPRPT